MLFERSFYLGIALLFLTVLSQTLDPGSLVFSGRIASAGSYP